MPNLSITNLSLNQISVAAGATSGDSAAMNDAFFRNQTATVFVEDPTYAPSGIPTAYGSETSIGLFRNALYDSGSLPQGIIGPSSLTEPDPGITKYDGTLNTLNLSIVENIDVGTVSSLDKFRVQIQDQDGALLGGSIVNYSPSNVNSETVSATGYTVGGYEGVFDFTAQNPDFIVSLEKSNAGSFTSAYRGWNTINTTVGTTESTVFGTVSVVGEQSYKYVHAGGAGTFYWEAQGTGVNSTSDSCWQIGYTDNGVATTINNGNLRGRVITSGTVDSAEGTFNIRLGHHVSNTNKTFKLNVYSDAGYSSLVGNSSTITVNSSTKYLSHGFSASSINEDNTSVTYTVNTTGVVDSTTVGYRIKIADGNISLTDIEISTDNSNWSTPTVTGTITITSNQGILYFRAVPDSETEPDPQAIIIILDETDSAGNKTGSFQHLKYAKVDIADTSTGAAVNAQPTTSSYTNSGSSSGTVTIDFQVQTAGTFYASSGGTAQGSASFSNGTKGNWLLSGNASDYEVQITWSGDTGIISGPTGFNALSSTRTWTASETYPSGVYSVTGNITIRDIATSGATEQDTGSITLNINAV